MQYNITFSVRFFCPRAISKLGDKTHPPGHIFFIIIFVLDIAAVSILEYPNEKFSIWDKFKRCKKLEINWHYLNPIPIFKDFISHSQRPNPSPSNPNPIFPAKNRPISAPILPLHDPLYNESIKRRGEISLHIHFNIYNSCSAFRILIFFHHSEVNTKL